MISRLIPSIVLDTSEAISRCLSSLTAFFQLGYGFIEFCNLFIPLRGNGIADSKKFLKKSRNHGYRPGRQRKNGERGQQYHKQSSVKFEVSHSRCILFFREN